MDKLTHIDKLRNPNYLGGWDFQDESGKTINKIVTIKEVKTELVFNQKSQSEETKITLHFKECKPIILNTTNRKVLKKVTGTDFIEEMTNKKVELTTKRLKAFGEWHDAIRIVSKAPTGEKVVEVSIDKCIAKLATSTNQDELVNNWVSLTPSEKKAPEVLAEKERLKTKFQ
tara:strand:- start:339 stop:854 length:516 start_codon:yes stop_codon:yes gene_type:complete